MAMPMTRYRSSAKRIALLAARQQQRHQLAAVHHRDPALACTPPRRPRQDRRRDTPDVAHGGLQWRRVWTGPTNGCALPDQNFELESRLQH